jgi:hypothetical protein
MAESLGLDLSADNTAEKQRGRPFEPGQSAMEIFAIG